MNELNNQQIAAIANEIKRPSGAGQQRTQKSARRKNPAVQVLYWFIAVVCITSIALDLIKLSGDLNARTDQASKPTWRHQQ